MAENEKVTECLSLKGPGAVLCPICESGYLVTFVSRNVVNGVVSLECYYERCINGCGSEQASKACVDRNAEIARDFKKRILGEA